MKDFSALEEKLNLRFKNKNLLQQAFCHRSYLNERSDFQLSHNERLEFLGDAVLELVVTEHLYNEYPNKPEGELTVWRAALVNAKMLSRIAQSLGFNDFLLLSKGEEKEKGKARQYILANALEAFVGAIYLDSGLEKAKEFIEINVMKELSEIINRGLFKDNKSRFQEEAQERKGITPTYQVLEERGPDHAREFRIGVFLEDRKIAEGEGSSKQEAEEAAARNALEAERW